MTRKPLLTALCAVCLIAVVAVFTVGCGGSSGTEGGGGGNSSTKKLTVASDIPFPPFEQGKKGSYTGFDIELIEAIGEEVGREPEIIDSSFETIFRDLAQGKFEVVASAATITPERERVVTFSDPYYLSSQAVLVREGSPLRGIADLKGKVVGAQQGTTGLELGKEKAETSELRAFPEGPDAIDALKAGTIEAVIIDTPTAAEAVTQVSGIEVAEDVPTEESYGFAVSKENTELLEEINEGLAKTLKDGKYAQLYEKWFHKKAPVPALEAADEGS